MKEMDNTKEIEEKIRKFYSEYDTEDGLTPYGLIVAHGNKDFFLPSDVERKELEAKISYGYELLQAIEEDAMRYPHRKIPKWIERVIKDELENSKENE